MSCMYTYLLEGTNVCMYTFTENVSHQTGPFEIDMTKEKPKMSLAHHQR